MVNVLEAARSNTLQRDLGGKEKCFTFPIIIVCTSQSALTVLGRDFVLSAGAEQRAEQKCNCRGAQDGQGNAQQI